MKWDKVADELATRVKFFEAELVQLRETVGSENNNNNGAIMVASLAALICACLHDAIREGLNE